MAHSVFRFVTRQQEAKAQARAPAFLLALLFAAALFASVPITSADVAPPECFQETDHKVDLVFVIDLTGSMGGELASVKSEATAMLNQLAASLPDPRFGVASFMDYPAAYSYPGYSAQYGASGDYPWSYDQGLSADPALSNAAIQSLILGSGYDWPESYSRAYLEVAELPDWRADAHRIVVVWGDAPPHDDDFAGQNNGLDPGRDAIALTSDDLDFQNVVQQVAAAGVRVMAVNSGGASAAPFFQYAASETGGIYRTLTTANTMADEIEDFVDTLLVNDIDPPMVTIDVPQEGRLYVNGVDVGPTSFPDRALVVGDLPVAARASDVCLLEEFHGELGPGAIWSDTVTGLALSGTEYHATLPAFPGSTLPVGSYRLDVDATDWIGLRGFDHVDIELVELNGQSMSIGAWVGTNAPASVEQQTTGLDQRADGTFTQYTAEVDLPQYGMRIEGIEETVARTTVGTSSYARSYVEIAEVSLSGGTTKLLGLTVDLEATFDIVTGIGSIERTATIAQVMQAGQVHEIPSDGIDGLTLETPLGRLTLFEHESSTDAAQAFAKENILHFYGAQPYGRQEVIIGSALVQAGLGVEPQAQERLILPQDDARSGGDAGDDRTTAVPVGPGVFDAKLPAGDRYDAYVIDLVHGDKINAVIQTAPWANMRGGSAYADDQGDASAAPPVRQAGAIGERLAVRLYDPTGALRESDVAIQAGLPTRFELNADLPGTWLFIVERLGNIDAGSAGNYSAAVTVSPVPLLPEGADALSFADAPATCSPIDPAIPFIEPGAWPGVLRDEDFFDVYRFHANIGELVTVEVKPGETLDGVDMKLWLWDRDCKFLSSSDINGIVGLKGASEFVLELPSLYTGLYHVGIERINGVGNHYTTLTVNDPHPTVLSDAFTGTDVSEDPYTTGAAPTGAFQGELHEGDAGDGYLLAMEAGKETYVVVDTSLLSGYIVTLHDPNGASMSPTRASNGAFTWELVAPATGDYALRLTATYGGGGYTVAWGQTIEPVA